MRFDRPATSDPVAVAPPAGAASASTSASSLSSPSSLATANGSRLSPADAATSSAPSGSSDSGPSLSSSSSASSSLNPQRVSSSRPFARYGHPAMHSRAMYTGREGLGASTARRQTSTSTSNTTTTAHSITSAADAATGTGGGGGAESEGRSTSPTPLVSAFHASPFGVPGSSGHPTTLSLPSPSPHASSSSSSAALGRAGPPLFSSASPLSGGVKAFDMLAVENDSLLLALFVRPLSPLYSSSPSSAPLSPPSIDSATSDLAHELLLSFHRQFHPTLLQLYPTFLHLANNPQDATQNEDLLPHFAAFAPTLHTLLTAAYGHTNSSSSSSSSSGQQRHHQQPTQAALQQPLRAPAHSQQHQPSLRNPAASPAPPIDGGGAGGSGGGGGGGSGGGVRLSAVDLQEVDGSSTATPAGTAVAARAPQHSLIGT